ncbi:hypothetical protein [Mesorhizobium sp. CA12]|uniref:hypothetical protein n=1 Tax=Mesorhizobium sp. CA12 TaxID=2876644 RepID=UPI001CD01E21|nr:hypothetical protein [Mesorhizobium sp. CA12]MBZ9860729.1 hypothetical protein [Mesorhizobium sp. CA12]
MDLTVLLGLVLAFIPIAQPVSGWNLPRWLARVMILGSIGLLGLSAIRSAWPYVGMLATPWQAVLAVANADLTRQIALQGSVFMVGLIAATLLLVRPLRNEMTGMRKAMDRYVMPRHLSQEQQTKIADLLSAHPPQEVILVQPHRCEEASSYRSDFHTALTKGGWKIKTVEISDDIGEGVTLHSRAPIVTGGDSDDKPLQILGDALRSAGVAITGTGSGRGQRDTEYLLYLKIGRRRMDDNDLILKEEIKQQIGELQKQLKRTD